MEGLGLGDGLNGSIQLADCGFLLFKLAVPDDDSHMEPSLHPKAKERPTKHWCVLSFGKRIVNLIRKLSKL